MFEVALISSFLPVTRVWWLLTYGLWAIASACFLLSQRRRPQSTLAWLLGFWSLPITTTLCYLAIGPRRVNRQRLYRQAARQSANAVSPLPENELPAEFEHAVARAELARVTRRSGEPSTVPRHAHAIHLYVNGDEAFPEIEEAIRGASETIHVEYYIFMPDTIGTRLRDLMASRARDGVEVRLIIDAFGASKCPATFWTSLREAGAEVRVFNPPRFRWPQPGRLNFRCHRKIVVVDGVIAFTGGINVWDNNLTGKDGRIPWRNTHLRLAGPPTSDLQSVFLIDWMYCVPIGEKARTRPSASNVLSVVKRVDERQGRWFPQQQAGRGAWIQVVDSGPDEPNHDSHRLLFAAIASARDRLWITTPYFIPDEAIRTALITTTARGVDVRLLIPRSGDSRLMDAVASSYAQDLTEEGAQVWLYEPTMNHSKTLLVDDEVAIVGTSNLDNRSFRLNFEVDVLIFDRAINAQLAACFETDMREASVLCKRNNMPLTQRLMANAARLLSPVL